MKFTHEQLEYIDPFFCEFWLVKHGWKLLKSSYKGYPRRLEKKEFCQNDIYYISVYWDKNAENYKFYTEVLLGMVAEIENKSREEVIAMFTLKMQTLKELDEVAERCGAYWDSIQEICGYEKKGSHE